MAPCRPQMYPMKKSNNNSLKSPPAATRKPRAGKLSGGAGGNGQVCSQEKPQAIAAEVSNQVPAKQAMETMVSMVDDDPCHVHVYWHVNLEDLDAVRRSAGLIEESQETMVLRLHDALCTTMTGFIPGLRFELEVAGLDGYQHVEIPDSGKTLVAELALRGADGGYATLASSAPLNLPHPDQAENLNRVELVLIDEPGIPPRVAELFSAPPGGAGGDEQMLSAEELRAINAEVSDQLPTEQAIETRVSMVDIDPRHAHVYWHINAADVEAARRAGGRTEAQENVVLRLHDALCTTMSGFIPWPPIELELTELSGDQCVEIPDAGKALVAELALREPEGTLVTLASSRPVHLPQPGQAEIQGPVELVVIDEPGAPPRVVAAFSAPSDETLSMPSPATPGTLDFSLPAALGSSPHPQGAPSSFAPPQWLWSGGPIPGFAGGEHD